MKKNNILAAITGIPMLFLYSSCIESPDPIGKEIIGQYAVTYTYVVYYDPWEGGGSDTVVKVDSTCEILLQDMNGNLLIATTPRYSKIVVPGFFENDSLIIPNYYFYPPGMTAHSIDGNVAFKGDSIFVYLDEYYSDWPQGGDGYRMYGKGIRLN